MLVITRRKDETIVIGGEIVVTVITAEKGRCQLGVVAPPDVQVDRGEVHARKMRELWEQFDSKRPPQPGA